MKILIKNLIQLSIILPVFVILSCSVIHRDNNRSQYDSNPFVIYLDIPAPEDDKGSVIVADLNHDGLSSTFAILYNYAA